MNEQIDLRELVRKRELQRKINTAALILSFIIFVFLIILVARDAL